MLAHEFGEVHAVVWLKSQPSTAFVILLAQDCLHSLESEFPMTQ